MSEKVIMSLIACGFFAVMGAIWDAALAVGVKDEKAARRKSSIKWILCFVMCILAVVLSYAG